MDLDSFIDVTIVSATIVMAAAPLIKDALYKEKHGNLFKKLTWSGWTLICSAIIVISFTFWKDNREASEKTQEKNESIKQHAQDSARMAKLENNVNELGYVYNESNNSLERFISTRLDSTKSNGNKQLSLKPLLNVIQGPEFSSIFNDTAQVVITCKNEQEGIASNIRFKVFSLRIKNGKITYIASVSKNGNPSTFLAKGEPYEFYSLFDIRGASQSDSNLIYYKINYTNTQNVLQPPLRKICIFPYPKIGGNFFDADKDLYSKVRDTLIKVKLW